MHSLSFRGILVGSNQAIGRDGTRPGVALHLALEEMPMFVGFFSHLNTKKVNVQREPEDFRDSQKQNATGFEINKRCSVVSMRGSMKTPLLITHPLFFVGGSNDQGVLLELCIEKEFVSWVFSCYL